MILIGALCFIVGILILAIKVSVWAAIGTLLVGIFFATIIDDERARKAEE